MGVGVGWEPGLEGRKAEDLLGFCKQQLGMKEEKMNWNRNTRETMGAKRKTDSGR